MFDYSDGRWIQTPIVDSYPPQNSIKSHQKRHQMPLNLINYILNYEILLLMVSFPLNPIINHH